MILSRIRIIPFALFFVFCLFTQAQETNSLHLIVWYNDNNKVAYDLSSSPMLFFDGDTLILRSDNVETIILSSVNKFLYANIDSIDNQGVFDDVINEPDFVYKFDGDKVYIQPMSRESYVSLMTIDGKVLLNKKVMAKQVEVISLHTYNVGVYLIKINNVVHKIVKI